MIQEYIFEVWSGETYILVTAYAKTADEAGPEVRKLFPTASVVCLH